MHSKRNPYGRFDASGSTSDGKNEIETGATKEVSWSQLLDTVQKDTKNYTQT